MIEGGGAWRLGLPWGALLGWVALATATTGAAYAFRRPSWLGKGSWWAAVMQPVLVMSRTVAAGAQKRGLTERVEVAPGLWVGGWPQHGAPGIAQLDLTAELPRRGEALRYANVPMLDGMAPSHEDWSRAVEQALSWRREGLPVLIHCAYGRGRSVAVLIGVMVAEGLAPTFTEAHQRVMAIRSRAQMTADQRACVAVWVTRPRV